MKCRRLAACDARRPSGGTRHRCLFVASLPIFGWENEKQTARQSGSRNGRQAIGRFAVLQVKFLEFEYSLIDAHFWMNNLMLSL